MLMISLRRTCATEREMLLPEKLIPHLILRTNNPVKQKQHNHWDNRIPEQNPKGLDLFLMMQSVYESSDKIQYSHITTECIVIISAFLLWFCGSIRIIVEIILQPRTWRSLLCFEKQFSVSYSKTDITLRFERS